jgi:hypothetical protein
MESIALPSPITVAVAALSLATLQVAGDSPLAQALTLPSQPARVVTLPSPIYLE